MELTAIEDIELDFTTFQKNINQLPNFYKNSNGNLNFINETNKDDFFNLNPDEISDISYVLIELNKAIQINIDETNIDECAEILTILRKSKDQTYQKSVRHKNSKKSMFKPLIKPKKIFVKVLKSNSPLKEDTQNTQNTQNTNSKKTAASNTSYIKSNNNIANMTEKVNDETNK